MKKALKNTSRLDDGKGENPVERQSLRYLLQQLPEEQLVTLNVKREDYLLSAIIEKLENDGRYPVVQLVDPESGQRTVANIFGDRNLLKCFINNILDTEEKAARFSQLLYVEHAPAQDLVFEGDEIDLPGLPVFRHFEDDAGRYITSGIVIAKDPDSGRYNFSFHRMQIKGKNRIGISLHSRGDLWSYFARSEELERDLEIAVVIGNHPAYYLSAATKIPANVDDYAWTAAFMDEWPKVVKAKTVDIAVPAYAEYILEGRIKAGVHEDEGPFGEYTGYSTSRSTRNVFEVSCITRRKDAIYQDLVPGFAWEHLLLSQFTKEIILLDKLKKEIPEVRDMCMPKNGCHFHAYLSIKPKAEGQARLAMMLLFGLDPYLKLIIAVDEDIDVHNEQEVLWAVSTRMQADKDVFIVPGVLCNRLDPSSTDGMSAKMGIDATRPANWEGKRITLPEDIKAKASHLISIKD